jgi:three-Cys-motif partner protein
MTADFKFDEIGYWSELKLEIIRKYAAAYTKIITASGFHPFYIDGFAGAGIHISKKTREYVSGSPLNALNTQPPFEKLFLVDLNTGKANHLREIAVGYKNVYIFDGDCNSVLLEKVFPNAGTISSSGRCVCSTLTVFICLGTSFVRPQETAPLSFS